MDNLICWKKFILYKISNWSKYDAWN